MATTMEQRAKFRELRLTGTSREDAMKQAYGSVAPTPPTPTGVATIPTQNFPSQPLNQQTTTGVNGETFKVAPVNAQGVTPQAPQSVAPIQPTPQPTPTQEVAPTTSVDKTAEIKAQNEAQMALNKQKSELAIQERKQQEADAKMANTPTDQKSILTSLIGGVSVPQQNTAAYRNAQFQYKNYQKFNSMTPQQLLDNMKMGEIDTATSQLLAGNPSYIKAKEDFDKFQKNQSINQMIKSVASGVTGKTETVDYAQQASDSLAKKLGIDQTNAEAYATIVSKNPEVVQLTQTVSSLTKQLNTLNTERNAVYADLKSQYPDLSASAIMTLMASRTKQTTDQIDALNSSLTLTSADLKTALEMAKGEYEATKEDIALQAQIAGEQRAMQNSLELAKAQNQIQQGNASFQTIGDKVYKVQNGQMTDTGIKAERDAQYQAYGGKLYKIKGDSVTEVPGISTLTPETPKTPEWKQDASGNWYNANSPTSPADQIGTGTIPSGKSLFDVLGKNVGTYEGNRGYDLAGALGDPLPAGGNWTVKSVDTAGEQFGSIFVGGKGSKPWGNTVVMEDENGNQIRYSHLQDINVKPGDVLGFGSIVGTRGNTGNVLGANGEKLTAEQLKAGRGAHVDIEIKDKSGRLLSNAEQVAFLKGLKGNDVISQSSLPLYRAYMEDGKLPSKDALKGLGMSSEQFADSAQAGYDAYLASKEQEINSTYPTLQIQFTPSYANISATQKEKLNESMTKIGDIDQRIEKLKALFEKSGTEVLPTKAKAEMETLRKQIILKAKEVENLGVLNGPDLGILESMLPSTTGLWNAIFSFDTNTLAKLNSIQENYRSDASTKGINYGAKITFKGATPTTQTNTGAGQVNYVSPTGKTYSF